MIPDGSEWVGPGGLAGLFLAVLYFVRYFLNKQINDLRKDVNTLRSQVEDINDKYDEERSLKHKALNDVAKTVMALALVRHLIATCTCGALEPLTEIIERLTDELETLPNRRVTDPDTLDT